MSVMKLNFWDLIQSGSKKLETAKKTWKKIGCFDDKQIFMGQTLFQDDLHWGMQQEDWKAGTTVLSKFSLSLHRWITHLQSISIVSSVRLLFWNTKINKFETIISIEYISLRVNCKKKMKWKNTYERIECIEILKLKLLGIICRLTFIPKMKLYNNYLQWNAWILLIIIIIIMIKNHVYTLQHYYFRLFLLFFNFRFQCTILATYHGGRKFNTGR